MRQQAVWHWLRRGTAGKVLFSGHSPACDVVDLKEAVRLMLAQPVAEQLQSTPSPGGQPGSGLCCSIRSRFSGLHYIRRLCGATADAEMHVGLLWAHPACASEADFLFGSNSGGKHGRGAKRRRGQEQPVQLGAPWQAIAACLCP